MTSHTVFELDGLDRLAAWRTFRNNLETSLNPFEETVMFWHRAPFVNPYLDPYDVTSWPDPWRLVIDLKLDNLAIALGMLYTLKLTKRFMDSKFEIHMSIFTDKDYDYFLSIDESITLDHQTGSIGPYRHELGKIWSSKKIQ